MSTETTLGETLRKARLSLTTVYCLITFDWDDVEVLDEEKNYKKLISEMIHIKKQQNALNSQNDTDLLDPIYNDFIRS